MAPVPKMVRGNVSLARGRQRSLILFIYFAKPASLYCEEKIYIFKIYSKESMYSMFKAG